ncbi:PGF-CTERM sorting domain-containing protein [Natronorubrum bangense]|uniref:PGF-CTERM sorting domain-containing protein n=1 Tax=Natronorubrum bangense TaxID=61858 RepID=A0A4D6HRK5_9EURY|nr:PGF-CTERM sorting domain-containing protein [Natronorubrum bangense]
MFLAALMVLSVVAMSAAFAGGAAATANLDDDNYDVGPTYTDATGEDGLDGKDVWIGQEVTIGAADDADGDKIDASGVEIHEGLESDDSDRVTTVRVRDGQATFDSSNLEEGEPYHLEVSDSNWDGVEFWVESEDFDADFSSNIVSDDGDVDLEISSDRDSQYVNITAEDLDAEELADLFGEGEEFHDDDDVLTLELSDDQSITADLDGDIEAGEYDFEFDVTDSNASDTATLEVTDEDADYYFVDVDDVNQGDFAEITIGVEQVDSAMVVLHEEDIDFASAVEVTDIEDDEVVLQYNTDQPSNDSAWSVHDDYDADVGDAYHYLDGDKLEQPLPVHNWDLNVGPGADMQQDALDDDGDKTIDIDEFNDFDRDRLVVNEHAGFGDTVSSVAPADETVDDLESVDEYATESNVVAEQDHFLLTLEDFGAEAAIESLDEDEFVVEIAQTEADIRGDSTSYFNSSLDTDEEGDDDEYALSVDLLNEDADEYDGDLIFAVAADDLNYEDAEHTVTLTVSEDNDYVGDEEYEAELDIDFEERDLDWDDIESLPANDDATATGTTNVAPGTELEAEADSPSDEGGFVDYTSAVVADDNTFAAEFDLEGEEIGSLFDLTAEDDSVSSDYAAEDAVLEDLVLTEGDEEPPEEGLEWDVDVDPAEPVEGDDVDVTVSAENVGEEMENASYEFYFAGDLLLDGDIELEGEESESWTDTVEDAEAGDYEWELKVDGDVESDGTLTVAEEDEPTDDDADADAGDADADADADADDDGEADDGEDDGTPGFGVAVAVVALLAAAMLALRRQN